MMRILGLSYSYKNPMYIKTTTYKTHRITFSTIHVA
nr:MAG TPA: hypothetical protein [Caudoviricetes sp.]